MPFDRVNETLAAIKEPWFLGPDLGDKYAIRLHSLFGARNDCANIDHALSLGFYVVHSQANKQQRNAVRANLLGEFLLRNQPVALHEDFAKRFKAMEVPALKSRFTNLFPAFVDDTNRAAWAPGNFTAPATVATFYNAQDWTNKTVPNYMFFVHSVRAKDKWIADPIPTMRKWAAISTGVMTNTNTRAYTSHGLILKVPANNVLSTSPTDQWFDNYAGTDKAVKVSFQGQSMSQHIAEKNIRLGGLMTPQQVAALTGQQGALPYMAGTGQTKHNEVVITGLDGQPMPYGKTGRITLLAFWMQTKMDGTFPPQYARSQGNPVDIERELKQYAQNCNVRLLYLPTSDANMISLV